MSKKIKTPNKSASPCNECPFRRESAKGWIGGHDDAIEIYQTVNASHKFPCHQVVNATKNDLHEGDEDDVFSDDELFEQACDEAPHCTGALIFMKNTAKRSDDPAIEKLRSETEKDHDSVFSNAAEFLEHHGTKDEHGKLMVQVFRKHRPNGIKRT